MGASEASVVWVAAGADRYGEHRGLGISRIDFKLPSAEGGGILIIENVLHARGGPARHLHYQQDEWFYAMEGAFVIEVGAERFTLDPGDSLLAPRRVPHVWAHVGGGFGQLLLAFAPAGSMEAFFREVTRHGVMLAQDPALWRAHGMELLGPPLAVE